MMVAYDTLWQRAEKESLPKQRRALLIPSCLHQVSALEVYVRLRRRICLGRRRGKDRGNLHTDLSCSRDRLKRMRCYKAEGEGEMSDTPVDRSRTRSRASYR